MTNEKRDDKKDYVFLSVIGRDRPGIVASVVRVLYQNRYNIEALSQTDDHGAVCHDPDRIHVQGEELWIIKKDCDPS